MICSSGLMPGSRAQAKRHIQERKMLIKNFNSLSAALKFETLIENYLHLVSIIWILAYTHKRMKKIANPLIFKTAF